jgi:anti-sigma factor RsiW
MLDPCRQFEANLDAFVGASLAAPLQQSLQAHTQECQRCAALLAVVQGASEERIENTLGRSEVLDPVLQSTSGRACQQSQSLLCDLVDGLLAPTDAQLVQGHLQHCERCNRLAQSLTLLRIDLPAMAELVPDEAFVDDIVAATTAAAAPMPRFLDRLTASWHALLQRPRFAWEVAWMGTALLLLLLGAPMSPLRDVPQDALAIVQTDPRAAWKVLQPHMERSWTSVRDDLQAGWDGSGGKAIDAVKAKRLRWDQEHPGVGESWQAMQARKPAMRQAIADGNLAQASSILAQLVDDLQDLWQGIRAAPSDSLGSPIANEPEEN